tara:strand:- start:416 stop:1261 length:846 start_codon:yes stop_codon:yes gene_type:complete
MSRGMLTLYNTTEEQFPLLIATHQKTKRSCKWYSTDNENLFKMNLKDIGSDWEYADSEKTLRYDFNSWGYRAKELDYLDKDNILVMGCSITEGIGLYQEDIWCNQLGQALDIDILNLGKGGVGPDILYINTVLFIKNIYPKLRKKKPNLIIYQWPHSYRKSFAHTTHNTTDLEFTNHNINTVASNIDHTWFITRYLKENGEMYKDTYINFCAINNMWKALDVPVLHWSYINDFQLHLDIQNVQNIIIASENMDKARDLQHDGKLAHSQVVDELIPKVKKML